MKILAIITVYHCDKDLFIKDVQAFIDKVDELLVWNNTPCESANSLANLLTLESDKIIFCGEEENKGISYALNYAWRYSKEKGYDYLLSMDQDSIWVNFGNYISLVNEKLKKEKAIFGPYMGDLPPKEVYMPVDYVITSGCLVPISILDEIGGYCSDFFVDGIDVELCYHAKSYGYQSYMVANCSLIQKFGTPEIKKILGKKYVTSNYPPNRIYQILRNHIIILRRYKVSRKMYQIVFNVYIVKFSLKILLGEYDKWSKLYSIYAGVWDGLMYKRQN